MKSKRPLRHESLESRRLLAAELIGNESPLPISEADANRVESVIGGSDLLREAAEQVELVAPIIFPGLSFGPDLVQEVDREGGTARLFVVDQAPYHSEGGALFIFDRTAEGGLELHQRVKLGVHVNQMFVQGDNVVLIGSNFDWRILAAEAKEVAGDLLDDGVIRPIPFPRFPNTLAITVNVGEPVNVVRQELEGLSHTIHQNGDELVVVSTPRHDYVIAIYPPPPIHGLVTTYEITDGGLKPIASTKVPLFGTTAVQDNDLFVAATRPSDIVFFDAPVEVNVVEAGDDGIVPPEEPVPPTVSVTRYKLGQKIEEIASADLGGGILMHFEVHGSTGVAVFTEFRSTGSHTTVALLDFSNDGVIEFEKIHLENFHGQVLVGGPDYVVLRSWNEHALVIIDANQSIDPLAENRVRKLELPHGLRVDSSTLLFGDSLVLRGLRAPVIEPVPLETDAANVEGQLSELTIAPPDWQPPPSRSVLLVVSLSKAQIVADTHLPEGVQAVPHEKLFLIDEAEKRFGLVIRTLPTDALAADANVVDGSLGLQFLFGRLTEEGEFQPDGVIPMGHWLEIDATPERLIARLADRIEEYDWNNVGEPTITPLPTPRPPIEAVDDEFRLIDNGEDHLLRVLANDVVHRRHDLPAVQIVRLIDAPEGAEIVEGHVIRIPAEALAGKDALRFKYVISDGVQQSQAVVEISVLSISEEQIKELVEAVRRRAAEDFGVPLEEVQVTSVERIFDQPLPIVRPNDPNHLDLSPGILVVVTVPDATALYAASLDGRIIQVFASRLEFLAELSLAAVDANGEPLDEIREGDEFFLQFRAKDLRDNGAGVYAAFFDLEVPTDNLVITGPVEFGPGFGGIPGGEFTESTIDELGGIGTSVEAPGGGIQEVLRIGVRAVGAGRFALRPGAADLDGNETLLHGRETEVPDHRVRYRSTEFEILPADPDDPLDADNDGDVSAKDALIVINFLGRHGTTLVADLPRILGGGTTIEGELVSSPELEKMMRLDTNRDGKIAALDALVVINRLRRVAAAAEAEEEEVALVADEAPPIQGIEKADKI